MVTRKELLALLASLPPECEGCSAPITGDVCEYCGREANAAAPALPDEPPDIRKTNASDDPCPMCQRVHTKSAYEPVICRCQKCGNLGVVALSTYDPILGHGIVCRACCGQATPANVQQMEAEAMARQGLVTKMPWQ
jgi:hypothetical protein